LYNPKIHLSPFGSTKICSSILPIATYTGIVVISASDDINVINPAFDMTPSELISGMITEKGVAQHPYGESIKKLFG
tara:strand:- start:525 stop:755 length:231 start_codon:yes stop_codon:yes gene_type:complete